MKSGYTSIILGGKNIETIDTFCTATQLDHLLSLFHPELRMPAFQIQSLIDTLMQRVDQLHPRDRDEYLSSSASPTFVFTDEELQLKAYTNGATAVSPHLYDYVCKMISEQCLCEGDTFVSQPNNPFLPPKIIRLVLQTLADLLPCDIFIHPHDVATIICSMRPPSIEFHVSKNAENGTFYNYLEDGVVCTDKSQNNLNVADLNFVTDEAVRAIQMLNSRGLGTENVTEHAALSSFTAPDSVSPPETHPLTTTNDATVAIPSSIPSTNFADMPTSTEFMKASTSELYQPTTENISDDEDQDSPSPPKHQKNIETLAEMGWYMNVGKSLQTHYDFVELLKDKLQKSRVQIENLESQLSKIGKSVTLLQSYYEKNVTIMQSLRPSGSNQTALDISAKHINDEIPRHILKRKNLKRRKTPSSWIINT